MKKFVIIAAIALAGAGIIAAQQKCGKQKTCCKQKTELCCQRSQKTCCKARELTDTACKKACVQADTTCCKVKKHCCKQKK